MAYRLVGTIDDRDVELLIEAREGVLGSAGDCDLVVDHLSVSRRHAQLTPKDEGVEVLDLGSKNGTYTGAQRIHRRVITDGEPIRFGQVELRLEAVQQADTVTAVELGPPEVELVGYEPTAVIDERSTASLNPFERFTAGTLRRVLSALASKSDLAHIAQLVGHGLYEALPVSSVEIRLAGADGDGVVFTAQRAATDGTFDTSRTLGDLSLHCRFASEAIVRLFAPLLDAALGLIALAGKGAREITALPQSPQLPEPPTVDAALRSLYNEAARVAQTDVGVMISGESGTGKEVLARYIHSASLRAAGPFVALNCAALPRDLLETELFGIERGVATGVEQREGKFEQADDGTLFLDEIGDMSIDTQAMILRALQEGVVYRIGGSEPRAASVRIIAATNKRIEDLLADGRFREDLYYRIATWIARVPSLRHRRDDIPNLAAFFLSREARSLGRQVRGISQAALDALVAYDWPGNVRQLENEMARSVAFIPAGGLLERSRLGPDVVAGPRSDPDAPLVERLQGFERLEILRALQACSGDTAAAAEHLGLPRSTLYRRMKTLDIEN